MAVVLPKFSTTPLINKYCEYPPSSSFFKRYIVSSSAVSTVGTVCTISFFKWVKAPKEVFIKMKR